MGAVAPRRGARVAMEPLRVEFHIPLPAADARRVYEGALGPCTDSDHGTSVRGNPFSTACTTARGPTTVVRWRRVPAGGIRRNSLERREAGDRRLRGDDRVEL